jgi:hypothetical protein
MGPRPIANALMRLRDQQKILMTLQDNLHDKGQYCYARQGNETLIETISDTQEGHRSADCRDRQELPSAHALAKEKCVNLVHPMMPTLD